MKIKTKQLAEEDFRKIDTKGLDAIANKCVSEKLLINKCFICRNKVFSKKEDIHNSHTVPQYILANLSKGQKDNNYKHLSQYEYPEFCEKNIGKTNAGIFRLICSECDNRVFKAYEDKKVDIFDSNNDSEVLYAIALKNLLKKYYNCLYATNYMGEFMQVRLPSESFQEYLLKQFKIARIIESDAIRLIRAKEEKQNLEYEILLKVKLTYRTDIAAQGCYIYSEVPPENDRIIFKSDEEYLKDELNSFEEFLKIEHPIIHIAVLPFESCTYVVYFACKGAYYFERFKAEFKKLSYEEQLRQISIDCLLQIEDCYLNAEKDYPSLTELSLSDYKTIPSGDYYAKAMQSIENFLYPNP